MIYRIPKQLSDIRRFFLEPHTPKQRQYEALRAYFVEGLPAQDVVKSFGYSVSAFHVLCHHFRRDSDPVFFVTPRRGPRSQPKKSAARDLIVQLRKRNYSVYEISETLKEQKRPLSPTAVREVLKAEGFAALPRRLDEERPDRPRPTVELVVASGLYRLLAERMRGYEDAQARQIFRDLVAMPATITVTEKEVQVSFHRRSHLPIILASGMMEQPVAVPWWNGHKLRLTTYHGPAEPPTA